jgi:hypothetical protein
MGGMFLCEEALTDIGENGDIFRETPCTGTTLMAIGA